MGQRIAVAQEAFLAGLLHDIESLFLLIERSGFRVRAMPIRNGACPKCSRQIPGIWN
jgi:hypothetical protein